MTARHAILAIDQGTTGSRALLVGHDGTLLGSAYEEFPQYFPAPGQVEHDAEEIWSSVRSVIERSLASSNIGLSHVEAIGITNQRETTVVWDRLTGRPLAPAIVWQDRRTASRCERLRAEGQADMLRARTGLVADPYFSATKLEWLLERNPEWHIRAAEGEICFGTIVGNKHLSMLKRIHGAGINIYIGVKLLEGYRHPSAFKERPQRCCG